MSDHGDRYTRFKFDLARNPMCPRRGMRGWHGPPLGLQDSALPVPMMVASNGRPEGSIATMALTSCGRASPISHLPFEFESKSRSATARRRS
jgi:hypothetical protein